MDKTKKFLNIAIGFGIIVCSLSLLIFSARQNKVLAQAPATLPNGVIVAGTVMMGSGFNVDYYVMGYDPKDGKVSVLGKISPKEMRN